MGKTLGGTQEAGGYRVGEPDAVLADMECPTFTPAWPRPALVEVGGCGVCNSREAEAIRAPPASLCRFEHQFPGNVFMRRDHHDKGGAVLVTLADDE